MHTDLRRRPTTFASTFLPAVFRHPSGMYQLDVRFRMSTSMFLIDTSGSCRLECRERYVCPVSPSAQDIGAGTKRPEPALFRIPTRQRTLIRCCTAQEIWVDGDLTELSN